MVVTRPLSLGMWRRVGFLESGPAQSTKRTRRTTRAAKFWGINQEVGIKYLHWDLRCVTFHNSDDLIYAAAETWNHTKYYEHPSRTWRDEVRRERTGRGTQASPREAKRLWGGPNQTTRCHVTYIHTPWSRVLLEKLTGLQLVKIFPSFYGTRRFIASFTSVSHLPLSWASSI